MKSEKNYNGIWMLVALVAMLALPVIIGHYTIHPANAATIQQADANATN